MKNIRNFSIIAHIDHGKSTLSDRIIQICNGVAERDMEDRILDSMDIEKNVALQLKRKASRSISKRLMAKRINSILLTHRDTLIFRMKYHVHWQRAKARY